MAQAKEAMTTSNNSAKRTGLTEAEKLMVPAINPAYHFSPHSTDILEDIAENRKVILTGHKGCGKTSLFEQTAARLNQPVMRVNMNGQTTISDFVGFWTAKGGETIWVDGALPLAMRHGYWLVVDEIDFAEASILSVLQSVSERNGKLFLKEKGHEIVVPHEHFRLLATGNTIGIMESSRHIYQGANLMNGALLDRFRVYYVDYLPPKEEAMVLRNTVADLTDKVASVLVQFAGDVRQAFKKEEVSCTISLRQLIDLAELMVRRKNKPIKGLSANDNMMRAAEPCIFSKISVEDGEVIRSLMQKSIIEPSAD